MGRRLNVGEGRDEEGLESRPGQGQGRDLSLNQSHEPEPGVRAETGRGQGKDWAGT